MACAAAYFAEDSKRDFAGDVYVVGSVHEECFEGISSRMVSKRIEPDYVVIGEASLCNLKRGQKGRAEIVVETFGKPAHSANPDHGINAVYKAALLIDQIRKLNMFHHPFLGDGILELTDIKSSPYPGASVVPDYCKMTYDRRLLVGETPGSVLKPILDLIVTLQLEDHEFKANAYFAQGQEDCYTGASIGGERYFPAWLLDEQDEYVQKVMQALNDADIPSKQLNWEVPDWVVLSVGDGCTIAGVWKGFQDLYRVGWIDKLPRLLGVQSSGCSPLVDAFLENKPWQPAEENTIADSIAVGTPRNPEKALNAVRESKGTMVAVSDTEILEAMRFLGRTSGIFGEPAGVAGLAGLIRLVNQKIISSDEKVVTIITGNGLKDVKNAIAAAGQAIKVDPSMEQLIEELKKRSLIQDVI
jgi:hypothetical protein